MSLVSIDENTCLAEGLCVEVCLPSVFVMEEAGQIPEVANAELCFVCGHCVAVCPGDSITLRHMDMENFPPVERASQAPYEQVLELIRQRRSLRSYRSQPVEREAVERVLEATRYAPTGSNMQSLRYVVVDDRATIEELTRLCVEDYRQSDLLRAEQAPSGSQDKAAALRRQRAAYEARRLVASYEAGEDKLFYDAPVLVVIHSMPASTTLAADSAIAAYAAMLAAEPLGLGSCFIGYFYPIANRSAPIRELLGIPAGNQVLSAFTLGYPALSFLRQIDRRRPTVKWISASQPEA